MTEDTAKTIVRLARQMIIEPHEKFERKEFIESVKLFNDIVSTLLEENQDDQ
jgi:hypothetical protein